MMPLLYDDVRAALRPDAEFATLRRHFGQAAVYDVSDVMPLFSDWERERERSVPRTPPAGNLWVEWRGRPGPGPLEDAEQITTGLWFSEFPAGSDSLTWANGKRWALGYSVMLFSRIDKAAPPAYKRLAGRPAAAGHYCDWFLEADGIGHACVTHPELPEWMRYPFDLAFMSPDLALDGGDALMTQHAFSSSWPAFMAFALLHCRNVVEQVEEPSSLRQKDRKREGKPRLTTYRTLRIEAPKTIKPRHAEDGGADDDGPKVRFHLCSGHFRELRSEKFTAKRGQFVWVQAHHRGAKSLGEVTGPRRLTPGAAS